MPFRLSHVVLHTGFVQSFTVVRNTGEWVNGRWVSSGDTEIPMSGVVSVANEKDLRALPEADRIQGMMIFHSVQQVYITRLDGMGTSDKILWNGQYWRLRQVWDYSDYGYYKAFGERIEGA